MAEAGIVETKGQAATSRELVHKAKKARVINEVILNRMIFLWRQSDKELCTRENPYEEEYLEAFKKFKEEYGFFGEKLQTEEEIEVGKKTHTQRAHFMDEVPEICKFFVHCIPILVQTASNIDRNRKGLNTWLQQTSAFAWIPM